MVYNLTKKIFIIGNGLDLNLGLKTNYKDFLEWIKKKNEYKHFINKNHIEKNKNIWIQFYLGQNIDNDYSWFNFEADLARILNNPRMDEIKNLGEKELVNFWINGNPFLANGHHLYTLNNKYKVLKKIKSDWEDFSNLFLQYLEEEYKNKKNTLNIQFWKKDSSPQFFENNFLIFNFNFTNVFKIEENNYYVNGNLKNGFLGSDDIKNIDFWTLKKSNRNFNRKNNNSIEKAITLFLKENKDFYVIEIIVLGHSISKTDWDLYKKIIKITPSNISIYWKIYFKDQKDKFEKSSNLFELDKDYFQKIKDKRSIIWIEISEKNYQEEFPWFEREDMSDYSTMTFKEKR